MTIDDVHALPSGYQLNHYRIESVIGRGGFGITYLAQDTVLRKTVAIKEYLPIEFAVRVSDSSVQPRSRRVEQDYRWGLERFLDEARTLARFRHSNLVPVLVFFEANGTAYMVMEFEKGHSLGELLADEHQRQGLITRLPILLEGILSALKEVHAAGFLHRDIKPANIILHADGSPVLVDFGSARHAMGQRSRTLTSIVTPRYAPLEQYALDGRQGPWSDLYGLAAVLHHVIVGEPPPEAVNRVRDDPYRPLAARSDLPLPRRLLEAIDRSLAVHAEQRPQSIAAFRALAAGTAPVVEPAPAGPPDHENAPTRILAGDAGRMAPTALPELRPDPAPPARAQDGQLRAMRSEDRIRPPPPTSRPKASPIPMGLGISALLLIVLGGLYYTDRLPFRSHGPVITASTGEPAPSGGTPTQVGTSGQGGTGGTGTPTPPVASPPSTGQGGSPPIVAKPQQPPQPPRTTPTPTTGTPSQTTGSPPTSPPQTPPVATGKGGGPSITDIVAAQSARDEAAAREQREKSKADIDQVAQAARQQAERAAAIAQQAKARAGAARLRAAEAAKVDLQGAERVSYGDNSVYIGQIANGKRNGLGVVERPDGERQAGEWIDDKLSGLAVLTLPDGRRYEGEWAAGVREGLGVTVLGAEAEIAGQHASNEVRGLAVWKEPNRERAGIFQGMNLQGPAVETFNGERYEGEFSNGIRAGKGVLVRTDGTRQHGMFVDGRRDG